MTRRSDESNEPDANDAAAKAVLVVSRWERMSIASEIHAAALAELRDFPSAESRALAEIAEEVLSVVCNATGDAPPRPTRKA